MNKAIIVEVSSRHLIVLADGGEFKKIKNTNPRYQVGQEITLPSLNTKKESVFSVFINWKTGTAVALAIILLFFQVLSPISGQGAYAYVGMDMDPSLELKINEDMQVLDIKAFNDQGHNVLEHMDEWEKEDIAYVTDLIFETCEDLGYLKTKEEVLITTTLSEEIPENKEKEMKEKVNEVMNRTAKKKSVEMTTIVMSSKEREKAEKMKISPGHYAIYTAAKNSGINITKKEISGHTIEEISEKVGPIKELLESTNETKKSSTENKDENHVYEPPLPVLDKKEDKAEEKAEKEKPVTLPAGDKAKVTRDEKSGKSQNNLLVTAAAPKKEEKISEPPKTQQLPVKTEKEKEKNSLPAAAAVPETEATVKPPAINGPAVTQTVKPKEDIQKEEKEKEEKPKKEKSNKPPAHPEEPVIDEQKPLPEQSEDWIYIEIIADGMIITVKIDTDSKLLKEELTKHALALINQNLIVKNEYAVTSSQELTKPDESNNSLNTQLTASTSSGEVTETTENTLQAADQKAS